MHVAENFRLEVVAVMFAVPGLIPSTIPNLLTVATSLSEVSQITRLLVASFGVMSALSADTSCCEMVSMSGLTEIPVGCFTTMFSSCSQEKNARGVRMAAKNIDKNRFIIRSVLIRPMCVGLFFVDWDFKHHLGQGETIVFPIMIGRS